MDWPRIPLPGDANLLRASAALGATLATLLDPETPAPGVSTGTLRAGLKTLGLPTKRGGKGLDADDLKLAARWGSIQNAGSGRIVMPGPGLTSERAYTDAERAPSSSRPRPGSAMSALRQALLVRRTAPGSAGNVCACHADPCRPTGRDARRYRRS